MTSTKQLRQVTKIDKDNQGRDRVHYKSKSGEIAGRPFDYAATIANPPEIETFAKACEKHLNSTEVNDLRNKGIILPNE